jgi:uncharacterized protein YecE (DUF72 family)|tara:strand:+ start:1636 stop:2337 length:702 start_codon:yes stop_codon:yes gene_type:complete
MALNVGTSGFSYKEWKGAFYPQKLPNKDMLAFYGKHLSAVEINNTFYRLPKREIVENWVAQVPKGFRFSIKAPRSITHFRRLKDVHEVLDALLATTLVLGDRLGAILFQLPPNFRKDISRLIAFLDTLPKDLRAAFEFRNDTWFDDEVYAALRAHGATLVTVDSNEKDGEILSGAPWGYLRLRKDSYSDKKIAVWAKNVGEEKWDDAFVFFKHEDAGRGPKMAKKFLGAVCSS